MYSHEGLYELLIAKYFSAGSQTFSLQGKAVKWEFLEDKLHFQIMLFIGMYMISLTAGHTRMNIYIYVCFLALRTI